MKKRLHRIKQGCISIHVSESEPHKKMTTQTESIWHDSRTDSMILTDPGHGKGPHKVDNAQEAAQFWNTHKDERGSMLRDPYNGHYWTTAEAREKFMAATQPASAPVAKPITVTVLPTVTPSRVTVTTQLWEPCEKCGSEPSYQTASGHLCENCQH